MPRTNTADITPATTYQWGDRDQTFLIRTNLDGTVTWVSAGSPPTNGYAEFLSSGATAAAYVEPEPPAPLSTEEKVNNMLAAFDLTREEMQAALAAK